MTGDPIIDARRIIVIADDLSGAAELAGIAAARGLTAEVQRDFDPSSGAQVLAVDADSRSASSSQAALQMRVVAAQIAEGRPARVYKKVDSVLRGHVRAEIEALLKRWRFRRAVLIPANPSRGRTIALGSYLIDGVPLDETVFADDPEFPRRSNRLESLLDPDGSVRVHIVQTAKRLPPNGIIIPDATSLDDLRRRASKIDSLTLPAGAADFFTVLLDHWCGPPDNISPPLGTPAIAPPALLVCGSHSAWNFRREQCQAANLRIVAIGVAESASNDVINFAAALAELQANQVLVLASGEKMVPPPERATRLLSLAHAAALIVRGAKPATLLVEGGATAAAVAAQLGWSRFAVEAASTGGIGVLKPIDDQPAPLVLIKPGSYSWPAEIWEALCRCRLVVP